VNIGVFDSGVGGLTVVRALRAAVPGVGLVYLGDTARVPYGIRSRVTVRGYAREAAEFLARERVDGIVVACNTASATALDVFAEVFRGPVLGMVEPGVASALRATRNGRIGVIGTQATIRSDAYGARIRELRPGADVVSAACPLFVPLAEEGWTEGDVPRLTAERYLAPLREAGIDTLVLGCTHYPLLKPFIGQVMGPDVALVDSAEAAAQTVADGWPLACAIDAPPFAARFCVTDAGGTFATVAGRFLGETAPKLETVHLDHGGA
jgi:glutamate racemase